MAGYTESYVDPYEIGYSDVWLIRVDANGTELWNRTFDGAVNDGASSVLQTLDGGYVIAGYTRSYGAGAADAWLIKVDANGTELWNKTYGGGYRDGANFILQTRDRGYIFVGVKRSTESGSADAWLVKTDVNGNEQWNKTFGETYSDGVYSILQTKDDGYMLIGSTSSFGVGGQDAWLIKVDSNGTEKWNKTLGGYYSDSVSSLFQTSDNGYVLAGSTKSYGAGGGCWDAWLIKTDENGNELWNETFGGSQNDGASSVLQTLDGGFILTGYTNSYGPRVGSTSVWLIKLGSLPNSNTSVSSTIPISTETPSTVPPPTPLFTASQITTPKPTFATPTPLETGKRIPGFELWAIFIGLIAVLALKEK